MMKRLLLAFLILLSPLISQAQRVSSNPVGANLSVQDAGTCSTVGSFLWQQLPNSAGTTTLNLAGTFSATVTVRESNNGGGTWSTAATLTTTSTTTYSTNGFTDFCADVTTYTSGTVNISISTGLLQIQQTTVGPVSPGSNISVNGQFNPKNYGALGGAKASRNVVYTQNSAVVTSADSPCPWTASSVGQKFQGVTAGSSEFGASGGGNVNNEVLVISFGPTCTITLNTNVNNGASGTGYGVTYPQAAATEAAAFCCAVGSANAAAGGGAAVNNEFNPGYASPTLAYAGTILVPTDGYVVGGPILEDKSAGNFSQGVSLVGNYPVIYVPPSFVPLNPASFSGALMLVQLAENFEIGKFFLNGMNFVNTNTGGGQGFIAVANSRYFNVHDIEANDIGSSVGGNDSIILLQTNTFARTEGLNIQNGPGGDVTIACFFNGDGLMDNYNDFCSNHFVNLFIFGGGLRTSNSGDVNFYGFRNDECGSNGVGCAQIQGAGVTFDGCLLFGPGNLPPLDIDTTSVVHLHNCNVSAFNTDAGNANAIVLHGNAQLYYDHSDIAGNNTGSAINGPSTATVLDDGANNLWNQVGGVRTLCTAANFTTCGASGGVAILASLTHAQWNFVVQTDTVQTWAVFPTDQNIRVTRVTAESGNTPTCTVAPNLQLSDGTRTINLALSLAAQLSDSGSISQVLGKALNVTGAMTAAGTCTTAPAFINVNVDYMSVINN